MNNITVTVEAEIDVPSSASPNGKIAATGYYRQIFAGSYSADGLATKVINDSDSRTYWTKDRRLLSIPQNAVVRRITKIHVEISNLHPIGNPFKNLTKTASLPQSSATAWNTFTWHEDFVADLTNFDLFSRRLRRTLTRQPGFILKVDGSLEVESRDGVIAAQIANHNPAGTLSFDSGYREPEDGLDKLELFSGWYSFVALETTGRTGRFFIVPAESTGSSTLQIWAYRDDQYSLLIWKRNDDNKYRVVTF
jgi:hypothetical protein